MSQEPEPAPVSEIPPEEPPEAPPIVAVPSPATLIKAGIETQPTVLETGPLSPDERIRALAELAKVADEQNKIASELESKVGDVIPEVGAVFETIAENVRSNLTQIREAQQLVKSDQEAGEARPLNLNNCFERALSIKRSFEGIPDVIEVLSRDEISMGDAQRRIKDSLKAARQQIARSECLFARAKTLKLRQIDEAMKEVDGENLLGAYMKLREL